MSWEVLLEERSLLPSSSTSSSPWCRLPSMCAVGRKSSLWAGVEGLTGVVLGGGGWVGWGSDTLTAAVANFNAFTTASLQQRHRQC